MMRCIICGCTGNSACSHPTLPNCHWLSIDHALCSNCADPEVFLKAIRPIQNIIDIGELPVYRLILALKAVNLLALASLWSNTNPSGTLFLLTLIKGDVELFNKIIRAWFTTKFPEDFIDGVPAFVINMKELRTESELKSFIDENKNIKV
jgi:hypothetical protein